MGRAVVWLAVTSVLALPSRTIADMQVQGSSIDCSREALQSGGAVIWRSPLEQAFRTRN